MKFLTAFLVLVYIAIEVKLVPQRPNARPYEFITEDEPCQESKEIQTVCNGLDQTKVLYPQNAEVVPNNMEFMVQNFNSSIKPSVLEEDDSSSYSSSEESDEVSDSGSFSDSEESSSIENDSEYEFENER